MIRWPRGKYNGRRIVGFSVKFRVNLTMWRPLPLMRWNFGELMAAWLCFVVHCGVEYGD